MSASSSRSEIESAGLAWLESTGRNGSGLEPMAGDVSSRKYFRVVGASEILAHYPADLMRSYQCFLRTDELLIQAGVRVPEVLATDPEFKFMLTADVGDRQLANETEAELIRGSFAQAVDLVQRVRGLAPA